MYKKIKCLSDIARRLSIISTILVLCMATCILCRGETDSPSLIMLPRVAVAPVLNGKDDDVCWKDSAQIETFITCLTPSKGPAKPASHIKLACDQGNLFVFCRFEEPKVDDLLVKSREQNLPLTGGQVWSEDHAEIFFAPFGTGQVTQFMSNPYGGHAQIRDGKDIELPWQVATAINKKDWTLEMAIPAKSLSLDFSVATAMRFDIFRVRRTEGQELSGWMPVNKSFAETASFGFIVIGSLKESLSSFVNQQFSQEVRKKLSDSDSSLSKMKTLEPRWIDNCRAMRQELDRLSQPDDKLTPEQWRNSLDKCQTLRQNIDKLWRDASLLEVIQ